MGNVPPTTPGNKSFSPPPPTPAQPQPPTGTPKSGGESEGTSICEADWWKKDGNVIIIEDRRQDWDNKCKFFKHPSCNTLVVVEFYAQWSGPSRFIGQFIEKQATANTDVLFLRLNYDKMEDVASEEGVDVVPTFLLFKGGVLKAKIVGARRFDLSTEIDKLKQGTT